MLLRFDPFRNLDRLTREILGDDRVPQSMPMDCYRDGDTFVLHFDLPGIDTGTLEVTQEDNTLTVYAQRRAAASGEAVYLVAERPSGAYARHLFVGTGLDLESITAGYKDGVLTLTIPIAAEVRPRRINVDHGEDSDAALPTAGSQGRSLAAEAAGTQAAGTPVGVVTA